MKQRIIALGAEPASSTPDELAKRLANDLVRLQPIVKAPAPASISLPHWTARILRAHDKAHSYARMSAQDARGPMRLSCPTN